MFPSIVTVVFFVQLAGAAFAAGAEITETASAEARAIAANFVAFFIRISLSMETSIDVEKRFVIKLNLLVRTKNHF
jgi:hypothetical protein